MHFIMFSITALPHLAFEGPNKSCMPVDLDAGSLFYLTNIISLAVSWLTV